MKVCVRHLRVELKSVKKGNNSITEFVLCVQAIANSLLVVADVVLDQDHIDYILDRLPEEYNLFLT